MLCARAQSLLEFFGLRLDDIQKALSSKTSFDNPCLRRYNCVFWVFTYCACERRHLFFTKLSLHSLLQHSSFVRPTCSQGFALCHVSEVPLSVLREELKCSRNHVFRSYFGTVIYQNYSCITLLVHSHIIVNIGDSSSLVTPTAISLFGIPCRPLHLQVAPL